MIIARLHVLHKNMCSPHYFKVKLFHFWLLPINTETWQPGVVILAFKVLSVVLWKFRCVYFSPKVITGRFWTGSASATSPVLNCVSACCKVIFIFLITMPICLLHVLAGLANFLCLIHSQIPILFSNFLSVNPKEWQILCSSFIYPKYYVWI